MTNIFRHVIFLEYILSKVGHANISHGRRQVIRKMKRTVKKVIDGDTIVVNRKIGNTNKIRLANVYAPEKGTKAGRKATNILRGLVGGKSITLTPKGRSYDRVVAEVRLGRKSVNKRMREKLGRK